MKMISSDNAKTLVILTALAAMGYVVWKLYGAGSDIKDKVAKTISDVVEGAKQIGHSVDLATTRVGARARAVENGGAVPGTGEDQSTAESARLGRQNSEIEDSLPTNTEPIYDPMGNLTGWHEVVGQNSGVYNAESVQPSDTSPDALGYPL